jgi:Ca2+-binding EF-hand superfamily protein
MGNKDGKPSNKDGKSSSKDKAKVAVPKKLTKKDYQALMKATGLTEKEIKDIFDKFMTNNADGTLDKAEFARLYQILRKEPANNLDEITDFVFRG